MIGTVVIPSAGSPVGLFPERLRSTESRMYCAGVRMPGRWTICAAVTEASSPPAAAAVEIGRKPRDLYEVLRVKKSASQSEIKSAYRTLAKIYHPDVAAATASSAVTVVAAKHPEESYDGCDFIEIHKAYSTLSDPAARAIYDLTLSIGSERRRPLSGIHNSSSGGFRRHSGFYTSRRWETDQCW